MFLLFKKNIQTKTRGKKVDAESGICHFKQKIEWVALSENITAIY